MNAPAPAQKIRPASDARPTPMMAQYIEIKVANPDCLLFYRMGDFYEMFFEDAERAAPLLDVTLTSRNKDDPNPIPMCGVPVQAAQGYVSRLVQLGVKVAICEPLSPSVTVTSEMVMKFDSGGGGGSRRARSGSILVIHWRKASLISTRQRRILM